MNRAPPIILALMSAYLIAGAVAGTIPSGELFDLPVAERAIVEEMIIDRLGGEVFKIQADRYKDGRIRVMLEMKPHMETKQYRKKWLVTCGRSKLPWTCEDPRLIFEILSEHNRDEVSVDANLSDQTVLNIIRFLKSRPMVIAGETRRRLTEMEVRDIGGVYRNSGGFSVGLVHIEACTLGITLTETAPSQYEAILGDIVCA